MSHLLNSNRQSCGMLHCHISAEPQKLGANSAEGRVGPEQLPAVKCHSTRWHCIMTKITGAFLGGENYLWNIFEFSINVHATLYTKQFYYDKAIVPNKGKKWDVSSKKILLILDGCPTARNTGLKYRQHKTHIVLFSTKSKIWKETSLFDLDFGSHHQNWDKSGTASRMKINSGKSCTQRSLYHGTAGTVISSNGSFVYRSETRL